ncbi:MAG: hypothetical protein SGI72_07295 [Planctomycetota bacterium]|nr:hypothetical protein [Planctomycetota bacterium]
MTNTPGGTTDNSAVYVNSTLVFSKGSTPLAPGWGAGTVHNGLSWASLNSSNQLLVRGFATDPVSTPTNDWFASIMQLDAAFAPVSEFVFVRAGDVLPLQTLTVNTVRSGQDSGFVNASGQAIYGCDLDTGSPPSDAVVYLWNGTSNVLLAQEALASPVAGRQWGDLLAPELAINDAGDYLIKDLLNAPTATDGIIAKNGAKFVQEGDNLPAIGAFLLTTFGNTPVSLTAAGNVLWYGDWDNPTTTVDTGIFLDQTLLVQKGVTPVMGSTLTAIGNVGSSATAGQNGSLYISPNGRYVIFTARVGAPVNKRGIFLLDITLGVTASCFGDGSGTACPCGNAGSTGNGCANSAFASGAKLATSGVPSIASDTLVLTASDVPGPGLFFQGTSAFAGGSGITFGDGLLCAGGTITRMGVVFPTGSTASYPGGLTPNPVSIAGATAVGDVRNYQCWYRDSAVFCSPETYNLTNLVTLTWMN